MYKVELKNLTENDVHLYQIRKKIYVNFLTNDFKEFQIYLKYIRDIDDMTFPVNISNMFELRLNEFNNDIFIFHFPDEETAFYFTLKFSDRILNV